MLFDTGPFKTSQISTHLVLHVWGSLHVSMGPLNVTLGPLHVSMGSLHVTWGPLHISWRPMQPSRGSLHVAHPIVVWRVAVGPGWGPHHPTLWTHHVPLRWRTLRIPWTHSSRRGAHHPTMGPLHPSGSHTMRPLGTHISGRAWVSLHVWWSHIALSGPLVRLGSRRWSHLSRGHERRLHASGAHWRPHVVGHLLRRHVWGKALLAGRHWAPREGGHRALSLRGPHVPVCVHPVHLHLLQREPKSLK